MRKVTLCFLVDDNQICLAMKKRGFGVGKWNGIGGKVERGETIKQTVIRELKEEIGVDAEDHNLEEVGNIKFYFDKNTDFNQHMYIFFIKKWAGKPIETGEMAPRWYDKDKLPYKNMWIDDPYWLPKVLEGKKIEGEFHFIKEGSEIDTFELKELE